MGKMHLYKIDEGIDHWIFAPNKREAVKLFRSHLESVEQEAMADLSVTRLEPTKKFTLDDDGSMLTMTAAEWIKERGQKAGYFACSEY